MGRISLAVKRGVRGAEHLRRSPGETTHQIKKMKVTIISVACLAALAISAPVPEADPEAFIDLGAVALPAITGSALIDGLLLGKVAFLKAAILANLLLGSESADEASDAYGAPVEEYGAPAEPINSYGAPAPSYEEPAPAYEAPAPSYEEPAPAYEAPSYSAPSYEAPAPSYDAPADTYGSPAADPLPAYAPSY